MSASGKSTVERILEQKGYNRVISCTTRPIRENEIEDVDYHYVTDEEFKKLADSNDLLENTQYREWHYGIRKSDIDFSKDNICVIEPNGYRQIKQQLGEQVIGVYLKVEDKERLLRSLHREVFPDCNEIVRRFISDKELFKGIEDEVDIVIDNWYTYETVDKIVQFVKTHRVLDMETFYNQYSSY
jgi:guanylate kinase